MVEHATYGSRQHSKELLSIYNWLPKQIAVDFVIPDFNKFW